MQCNALIFRGNKVNESREKQANMDMDTSNGYHCPNGDTLQELNDCANRMRITSIEITHAANSGYVIDLRNKLTGSFSDIPPAPAAQRRSCRHCSFTRCVSTPPNRVIPVPTDSFSPRYCTTPFAATVADEFGYFRVMRVPSCTPLGWRRVILPRRM
jgi:hypothetical protein